jgi:S-adenosylmethionine:tRNA ribosyltransferase-isomerase
LSYQAPVLASELDYDLPENLIAQEPPDRRDGGRLLVVKEAFEHALTSEFPERLPPGSLVVFNDTRVMRARLLGVREPSGAKVELLLLNPVEPQKPAGAWQALARCNRRLASGDQVRVGDTIVVVGDKLPDGSRLVQSERPLLDVCETEGHVPLPPYVKRPDNATDAERYQTVFSRDLGSAAAPTAGLHFTQEAITRMQQRGISVNYVTLHVGAGTFRPVTAESLDAHEMHVERYRVSPELARQIAEARARGGAIVAIGTTVVRALESAALRDSNVASGWQSTNLLIQPGFRFQVVDGLFTNFHAPKSTLLALVYAFGGQELLKKAYAEAIAHRYRFLSYGDAMWIPQRCK